jgi:tRNA threonylcarbamoyladenosine biosynthesis protein TsaE
MEVSLADLPKFAEKFVAELPTVAGERAYVVGLSGELGAGKTTFVQSVARALGGNQSVTSPTFVFAQRYAITRPPFTSLIHVDAYRLEPGEAHTIGWQDFLKDPANLILVEWPEKMLGDFPQGAPLLKFKVIETGMRDIQYGKE